MDTPEQPQQSLSRSLIGPLGFFFEQAFKGGTMHRVRFKTGLRQLPVNIHVDEPCRTQTDLNLSNVPIQVLLYNCEGRRTEKVEYSHKAPASL